jgi:methionyl aminopeptidase
MTTAPGVTTKELDTLAEDFIRSHGAVPAFLGYQGFPASLCISINEEVVHGIPSSKRVLREGDIVSVDCGTFMKGFVGKIQIIPTEFRVFFSYSRHWRDSFI